MVPPISSRMEKPACWRVPSEIRRRSARQSRTVSFRTPRWPPPTVRRRERPRRNVQFRPRRGGLFGAIKQTLARRTLKQHDRNRCDFPTCCPSRRLRPIVWCAAARLCFATGRPGPAGSFYPRASMAAASASPNCCCARKRWCAGTCRGSRSIWSGKHVVEIGCGPLAGYGPLAIFCGAPSFETRSRNGTPPVRETRKCRAILRVLHADLVALYGARMDFPSFGKTCRAHSTSSARF